MSRSAAFVCLQHLSACNQKSNARITRCPATTPLHGIFSICPQQEFQERDWDETAQDAEDAVLFEEDWDDTEINDDFTNQLRKELGKK